MQQIKNHKETIQDILYSKDTFTTSENGNEYPKSRIKVEYISYTGERLDNNNQYQPYNGDKIKITVSKLTKQDGNIIIKQKALTNRQGQAYVTNDEKDVILSTDEYLDMIQNSNTNL